MKGPSKSTLFFLLVTITSVSALVVLLRTNALDTGYCKDLLKGFMKKKSKFSDRNYSDRLNSPPY